MSEIGLVRQYMGMAPEFDTMDGITRHVETELIPAVRNAFQATRGELNGFGLVLRRVNRKIAVVKVPTLAAARNLALKTDVVGVIWVKVAKYGPTKVLTIGLEHSEFGDQVWHAAIRRHQLEEFVGPVAISAAPYELKPSRALPARFLN